MCLKTLFSFLCLLDLQSEILTVALLEQSEMLTRIWPQFREPIHHWFPVALYGMAKPHTHGARVFSLAMNRDDCVAYTFVCAQLCLCMDLLAEPSAVKLSPMVYFLPFPLLLYPINWVLIYWYLLIPFVFLFLQWGLRVILVAYLALYTVCKICK